MSFWLYNSWVYLYDIRPFAKNQKQVFSFSGKNMIEEEKTWELVHLALHPWKFSLYEFLNMFVKQENQFHKDFWSCCIKGRFRNLLEWHLMNRWTDFDQISHTKLRFSFSITCLSKETKKKNDLAKSFGVNVSKRFFLRSFRQW